MKIWKNIIKSLKILLKDGWSDGGIHVHDQEDITDILQDVYNEEYGDNNCLFYEGG